MAAGWIPKPTAGKKAVGPCAPDCNRWTLKHAPLKVVQDRAGRAAAVVFD